MGSLPYLLAFVITWLFLAAFRFPPALKAGALGVVKLISGTVLGL